MVSLKSGAENELKICDPAVGSGHFLVSALNEIIAIKNDLRILSDREGKRLKEYQVEVVNDELVITDEDGELFDYNPKNKESQRIQETLFHEKQTIIENCLFGVDINPNSVKICRLRLWIELLKNAYYKSGTEELETLPNIDINIKCGNSLVSRFDLDSDLKQALRKSESKWTVDSYRIAVSSYRHAESKEHKHEMERLINEIKTNFRSEISQNDPKIKRLRKLNGELFTLTNQGQLFELSKKEKAEWNKKVTKLTEQTQKLEKEIEEIKNNKIYENAFEWRFEFPEVLNDDGDFIGFDVIIGNPPYVFTRGNEFDMIKHHVWKNYPLNQGKINLYSVFLELGLIKLLKSQFYLSYITPETFIRTSTYSQIRNHVALNHQIISLDVYGIGVFEGVTAETITFFIKKDAADDNLIKVNKYIDFKETEEYEVYQSFFKNTPENRYVYNVTKLDNNIFTKLKDNSTPLGDIVDVRNGVATKSGKNNFISKEIINDSYKKLLEAPEISRYAIHWSGNYINYDRKALHRPRKEGTFLSKKILCQRVSSKLVCCLDDSQFYTFNSVNNLILSNQNYSLESILVILNSKLINYYYTKLFSMGAEYTITVTKENLSVIPIKNFNSEEKMQLESYANEITKLKINDNIDKALKLEKEADEFIYSLYELSVEEIDIVEKSMI